MNREDLPLSNGSIQAKKAFGQNFLVNASAVTTIVHATTPVHADRILEIGPGPGALTAPLLEAGRPLWAVELDPEACAYLEARFQGQGNFHLLRGDAVHVALPPGPPWSVVGNLPYNAATAILTRFLLEPIPWERLVFMFQLEVGQKILGRPGEKAYGPLSILAQLCSRVSRLMKLGPGSFRPAPKVDSVVLCFDPRPDAPDHAARARLLSLLHRSFAHRRKTLANNWQSFLDTTAIQAVLTRQGLAPTVRAEAIAPDTWLALLQAVHAIQALPEEDHASLRTDL